MSKITLDNLSDNLKAYLEGLGLSEEQVLNLINENGLDEEELKAMLKDTMSINELNTNSKTVIGAINELFQSANNGKELIASAIGEPLSSEDTFSAMSTDINGLLSTFKTNMMNNGVTVESGDKFKALIDKIATMVEEGSGKGIQYASGNGTISSLPYDSSNYKTYVINTNLDFTPTVLFWTVESLDYKGAYGTKTDWKLYETANSLINVSASTCLSCSLSDAAYDCNFYLSNVNSESFTLNYEISLVSNSDASTKNVVYHWYAIGVGEEDTTLRDSLASILEGEGVDVTEEDDTASLINKVDEEFDNRKQILVNALVNEGLNAEITNTYEELITMISLLKYVPANSIINGDSTDSDFINGLTSYSRNRGDADSEITYSVSNNTIVVEGSADCVETTGGRADEGKRDLYIYNSSYTVDVTDYDVFKVIASYSFYDMEYGSLEVGLYTGSDYTNPVKTIENGDLDITDLTGEYHIVIIASVWNKYYLGETGILEGRVSYIGFE